MSWANFPFPKVSYSLALPSSPVDSNSNHNNMDTSNILLATGEDRIVYGIDRRNWKIRHRWKHH